MARNKYSKDTAEQILDASKRLFLEKGYDETTIQDIANELVGFTKGAVYYHYKSKEEIMQALSHRLLFEGNSYDKIKERKDLNGLQKIQELCVLNQAYAERMSHTVQSIPLLKNPRILAAKIETNQCVLTPLWHELIEEGIHDGSIKTEYAKEFSELLPLLTFWLTPSVYPDTAEELRVKFYFVIEMLSKMGLQLLNKDIKPMIEQHLSDIAPKEV